MDSQHSPADDAGQERRRREDQDRRRTWADEAAQARTSDDPRARAPHDQTGTPSTGERR